MNECSIQQPAHCDIPLVVTRLCFLTFSIHPHTQQRKDFDDFLRDRVCSIRVWRSMGGNLTKDLCKHYCLRGLEPYQSPSLNAEMHSHRCMHHQTVLKEQKRQLRAGICDPVRIQQQVSHMSEWALRRAQKLAAQDARDVSLQQDTSSRTEKPRHPRRSSWHHTPTTPTTTSHSSSSSSSAASAVAKLAVSSSQSRVSSSRRRLRRTSLPNAQTAFPTSTASTVTSCATSVSSASSSSSLSSSSEEQQQQCQAVNVDQLKAWNVNLLQRMMSDQRHRRNSMNNPNANLAHSTSGVRRNTSSRNINSNHNSSSNAITGSVGNSLHNHHRAHVSPEMSLHSLLVAPRTELLSKKSKRTPDFSSSSSLPGTVGGEGAVDDSNSNSNNMPIPYRPFLRRDSLCGFKQL
jgi:hypothetical protein